MTFDRLDSLILRRFPKKGSEWAVFPIFDGACLDTLNLLVHSGCVQRKAKVRSGKETGGNGRYFEREFGCIF